MTAKITNIYGQYQQVKSRNRDDQRSSVGRLWTEEDLQCMVMDVFCADIADSLDTDARIQNMKTFCNWNKDWQQPSKGVGPRGDAVQEQRLNEEFLGIKLIYKEKLFWIHLVEFIRKRERIDITLLLSMSIMSEYFLLVYTLMYSIIGHVSINDTSAVLTFYLMNKRMHPLGILGIFIRTSPMSVAVRFMPLQMQMKRM